MTPAAPIKKERRTSLLAALFATIALSTTHQAQGNESAAEKPLTISHAYDLALTNDPEWSSLVNTIKADREILQQSKAGLLPSISASASTTKRDEDTSPLQTSPSEFNVHSHTLAISQPLLRLDRWFAYKRAQSSYAQLGAELDAAYQQFILRVMTTFFNVLRTQETLAFAEAEVSAISRQLDQTQQRFKVGLIAITDVHEAQAAYDLANANLIAAESEVLVAKVNLSTIIGQDVGEVFKPSDALPINNPYPNDIDIWIRDAKEHNPDLIAARHRKLAARQNKKQLRANHAPTLDVIGSYSHNSVASFNETDTTSIGLELTLHLYQGGAIRSASREAAYDYLAAKDRYTLALRTVTQNANNFFRIVQTDVLRVKARLQTIVSSQSALEATQASYEVGTRNIVDVLQAQRTLFAAKRDYANARFDYHINMTRLKETAGKLNGDDLYALSKIE